MGEPLHSLRHTLRTATLSVLPDASVMNSDFLPHITIAYCNTDGASAAPAVAVAERLVALPAAEVAVTKAVLVRLQRLTRSYTWDVVSPVDLGP